MMLLTLAAGVVETLGSSPFIAGGKKLDPTDAGLRPFVRDDRQSCRQTERDNHQRPNPSGRSPGFAGEAVEV